MPPRTSRRDEAWPAPALASLLATLQAAGAPRRDPLRALDPGSGTGPGAAERARRASGSDPVESASAGRARPMSSASASSSSCFETAPRARRRNSERGLDRRSFAEDCGERACVDNPVGRRPPLPRRCERELEAREARREWASELSTMSDARCERLSTCDRREVEPVGEPVHFDRDAGSFATAKTSSRSRAFSGRWLRMRPFGWLSARTAGCRIASVTILVSSSRDRRCPAWRLSCTHSSSAERSSATSREPSRGCRTRRRGEPGTVRARRSRLDLLALTPELVGPSP